MHQKQHLKIERKEKKYTNGLFIKKIAYIDLKDQLFYP